MRILHTSDWHLGKSLYDFSLLDDQQYMLDRLLELLGDQRIDALLLAGDIYDRPVPSARAVQLYDYFLAEAVGHMGIPVLAIAGNHDSPSRLEFGSSLYSASGYHICGHARRDIQRVTLSDTHGPLDVWLIPYVQPADIRALFPEEEVRTFDDAYRVLLAHNLPALDPGRRNIAVGHGFFSNLAAKEELRPLLTSDSEINIGGMDIADSGCFAAFDYTALGHLHAPQRAGSDTLRYSGSPLKYSLSEENQHKSYTILDFGLKGDVTVTLLPVMPLRDVRTVEGTLDALLEPSYHKNQHFGDYVFAGLTDDGVLYPMEKLRKLFPQLLGLRIVTDSDGQLPEIRIGGSMPRLSPEEMFARFYREVKGHDLPPDSLEFLLGVLAEDEGVAEL